MKLTLALLILLLCLLTSCRSHNNNYYYYSTMSSDDPYIFKNMEGEFVQIDDSIDVIYNFNGENAPITVGVYNKKNSPIYIDWRKSGLVIDGNVITYREPLEVYALYRDTSTVDYGRYLNDPEGLNMVKPQSRLNTQVLELTNFNFEKIPDIEFSEKNNKSEKSKFRSIMYTEEDSPIYMESFLIIYEQANDMNNPLVYESRFYMSELEKAPNTPPSKLSYNRGNRGDLFYVEIVNNVPKKDKKKSSTLSKIGKSSLDVLGTAAVVTGNIIVWALDGRGE